MKSEWIILIVVFALIITFLTFTFLIMPAIFLNPHRGSTKVYTITIENNEDFEDYGFQGTGTYQNPYRIENIELGTYEFKLRDYYTLLTIRNTTAHVLISNNTFIGCKIGIHLDYVKEGSILVQNNTFLGREFLVSDMIFSGSISIKSSESNNISIVENSFKGELIPAIYISKSSDLIISKNKFVFDNPGSAISSINSSNILLDGNILTPSSNSSISDHLGFYFRLSLNFSIKNNVIDDGYIHIQNSDDFMLQNNTLKTKVEEIFLLYISSANNVNISQNIFTANESYGLVVSNISNLKINNNTFNVRLRGLGIYGVQNSIICYNSFFNSSSYAIWNDIDSLNTTIYHNNFFDNNSNGDSQCYNEDTETIWYNVILSEGNYWNDLGINSTYEIDGSAGSVDLYPLSSSI